MFEIRSKETRLILVFLLTNTGKSYYLSELADKMRLNPSNAQKAINKLVQEGIICKKKRGGHWFYSVNKEYPLYEEVKKIVLFKYGLEKVLRDELSKARGLKKAWIFGSYARGEMEAESDIDILLVGDHSSNKVTDILIDLQEYFGREFNNIDMDASEFEKRKKAKDPFIENIFNHKYIEIL